MFGYLLADVEKKRKRVRLLHLVAGQHYALSQYQLAVFYEQGLEDVIIKDDYEAVSWYLAEADQRYSKAVTKLGKCYINGIGGLPKNNELGRALLMTTAAKRIV